MSDLILAILLVIGFIGGVVIVLFYLSILIGAILAVVLA